MCTEVPNINNSHFKQTILNFISYRQWRRKEHAASTESRFTFTRRIVA